MIAITAFGVRCRISLLFPALVTFLLTIQTDGLMAICMLASLIHEIGHIIAMRLTGMRPEECTLGLFGIRIRLRTSMGGYGKNAIVAAAGPLINGLSAAILWSMGARQSALVHLLLAVLNLLPVSVLDGGELLKCALGAAGCRHGAEKVLTTVSVITVLLLLIGGAVLCVIDKGNLTLLIVAAYPALLWFFEKISKTS